MKIETTLDMTIPLWGLLTSLVIGSFYIIKMNFELRQLSKDLGEIKKLVYELLKPEHKNHGKH